MARRAGTINATKDELRLIETIRRQKSWTTKEDSEVYKEISLKLLMGHWFPPDSSYQICLDKFEEDEDHIFKVVTSGKKDYKIKIRNLRQTQGNENPCISSLEVEDLIREGVIRADGVSPPTWRRFLKGEPISKTTFIKFWEGLGLSRFDITALKEQTVPLAQVCLQSNLFRSLLSFDHNVQLRAFNAEMRQGKKSHLFWIQGECALSRIWLMRRLEARFRQCRGSDVRYVPFDFKSERSGLVASQILPRLEERLGESIQDCLSKENLILIFRNIDVLKRQRFCDFLSHFYQELCRQIPLAKGSLLIFLVDAGSLNDWREDAALTAHTIAVPVAERFSEEEIFAGLDDVSSLVCHALDVSHVTYDIFQKSSQGIPKIVLEQIYAAFNCQYYREKQWQSYP